MAELQEDPLEALLAFAETEFDKHPEKDTDSPKCDGEAQKIGDNLKTNETQKKTLTEFDLFGPQDDEEPSLLHDGDTDSSDDETNRNCLEQKYNECGKQIKQLLVTIDQNQISKSHYGQPKKRVSTWKDEPLEKPGQNNNPLSNPRPLLPSLKPHAFGNSSSNPAQSKPLDVLIDPFFGIRIIKPLISHSTIVERMQGREAVQLSTIQRFLMRNVYKEKDWVICGVVVGKSPVKTSQKGSQYSIWTLSDLKNDIKTVALFMFSGAHKDLWKTSVGTVIGVLNPGVMERRDNSKDEATLSIDNAQKVMIFGQSKDYGLCKSTKKNGDKCNSIINLSICEFCIYHIKQEYQKCSRRSELQANFAGQGLTALRNKVLGKNEVFYAGKSYMAVPAKKSGKMAAKDESIISKLNGINVNSNPIVKAKNAKTKKRGAARQLDISPAQRLRDIELLKKLGGGIESKTNFSGTHSSEVTLESAKSTASSIINKLKTKKNDIEIPKSSQYDFKTDLLVEEKKNFSGKISEDVTLKDARSTAVSVISKLKAKNAFKTKNDKSEGKENTLTEEEEQDIEEMLASFECDEFNYDDDEDDVDNIPIKQNCDKTKLNKESNIKSPKSISESNSKEKTTNKHNDKANKDGSKEEKANIDSVIHHSKSMLDNTLKNCSPKSSTKDSKAVLKSSVSSTPKSLSNSQKSLSPSSFGNSSSTPKSNLSSTPKSGTSVTLNKTSGTFKSNSSTPKSDLSVLNNTTPQTKNVKSVSQSGSCSTPKSSTKSSGKYSSEDATQKNGFANNSSKNPALTNTKHMSRPTLSGFSKNDIVDLSAPVTKRHISRAKLNAIGFIKKHGPIKKVDPNSTKSSGKKRPIEEILNGESSNTIKKSKLQENEFISDRWKKMMAATSKHQDLIEKHYDEEKEKYFKKLEVKEKMEEKMTSTYKVACKAVRCLKCKYTSFSASDLCKTERHPLRVFDATKRFFKCGNCQNRTVSLEIIPTHACKNCGSGKWERTGMMKEKIAVVQHSLSIRGGEQKFINSDAKDASLDLLVPEDGA